MLNRQWLTRLFCVLVVLLLSSVSAAAPALGAQGTLAPGDISPDTGPQGEGPWVVRAYYGDRQMVDDLAAWLEPWEVHHDQGYLVVGVDRAAYDRMQAAGFRLEIDQRRTDELFRPREVLPGQVSHIPYFPCYRSLDDTYQTAQQIAAQYPHLATWSDIGDSWEKSTPGGTPGRDIMVLRLTRAAVPGPKPKLFLMTAIHAREYATAELATRFAEYLVQNYGVDADVTWLLDHHEVHLLLQANPDGRAQAEHYGQPEQWWRKNTNEKYCLGDPDNRGADLNRNYSFQWACCGGSSSWDCDETYHGPTAASEPETQAVQNYVRSQFPDQRDDPLTSPAPADATGVFLDIHSYSELVLWPWGFISNPAPNAVALQTLGRKFAYFNGYYPDQSIGLYKTDGTTDDFAYGELGLAAYTFEVGTDFFQDCATFESAILPDNLQALIYAAKVSRTPYQTPAGPDALNILVSPEAGPGAGAQLTATLSDTRYSTRHGTEPTQVIAAAEYYVDVPPWSTADTPVAHPMAAVDGAFDEKAEEVQAAVDTGVLQPGRHLLFVRGQDANGNWGAFGAGFLDVAFHVRVYIPLVVRSD